MKPRHCDNGRQLLTEMRFIVRYAYFEYPDCTRLHP